MLFFKDYGKQETCPNIKQDTQKTNTTDIKTLLFT